MSSVFIRKIIKSGEAGYNTKTYHYFAVWFDGPGYSSHFKIYRRPHHNTNPGAIEFVQNFYEPWCLVSVS